jgi:hypothetical protein
MARRARDDFDGALNVDAQKFVVRELFEGAVRTSCRALVRATISTAVTSALCLPPVRHALM